MSELVEKLCVLSVFFGLALSLMPEGTVKKLSPAVGAAALLLCLLDGVAAVDTEGLMLDIARYRALSETLTADSEALRERLDRQSIERECQTYIEGKAEELGLHSLSVHVTAQWSAEGFWMPETAELSGSWNERARKRLEGLIEAELGIPAQRQEWSSG